MLENDDTVEKKNVEEYSIEFKDGSDKQDKLENNTITSAISPWYPLWINAQDT